MRKISSANASAWLLLLLLALGACTTGGREPVSGGRALSTAGQWLVGGWVLEGDSCDSDAGVVFGADGNWQTQDASGTWRLSDRQLVFLLTRQEGDEGDMRQVEPPLRQVEDVQMISADEYRATRADGSVRRLKRCR
jgi:hypothetical protein